VSLRAFVDRYDRSDAALTVHNPESEPPLYRLLTALFDEQSVTVRQRDGERELPSDTVVLDRSDGPEIAVSPLADLQESVLLVNSDLYTTGTRGLDEIETPDVLTRLDEIPFAVSGTGRRSKGKVLLIELSRYLEARAWDAGEGTLHAGFQQLSRLDDERGTRRVYERLGRESAVETHLYGAPDASPSLSGVTLHADRSAEIRWSWFVVYRSERDPAASGALVVVRNESGAWEGVWTYDHDSVRELCEYLAESYPSDDEE